MRMHIEARHCGSSERRCQYCNGTYKNLNSLRAHISQRHREMSHAERDVKFDETVLWG